MNIIKVAMAALVAVTLGGCAGGFSFGELSAKIEMASGIYKKVTETTVPPQTVIATANAFNILKAGAARYGEYCLAQQFVPAVCDEDIRRKVILAVRAGTNARNQMEASVEQNKPALSSIYNVLVAAVTQLQTSPVSRQFVAEVGAR